MKSYSHTPLAKPATHVHWYACADTVLSVVESEHVAPFAHGLLAHSITSTSQLPLYTPSSLSCTLHCAVYCEMKSYSHTPLAKPATHVHWYACTDTVLSVVESEHVAPFAHGLLAHSITSTSQIPSSATVHAAVYCVMNVYPAQSPFA
jgi:hypothetical protein